MFGFEPFITSISVPPKRARRVERTSKVGPAVLLGTLLWRPELQSIFGRLRALSLTFLSAGSDRLSSKDSKTEPEPFEGLERRTYISIQSPLRLQILYPSSDL